MPPLYITLSIYIISEIFLSDIVQSPKPIVNLQVPFLQYAQFAHALVQTHQTLLMNTLILHVLLLGLRPAEGDPVRLRRRSNGGVLGKGLSLDVLYWFHLLPLVLGILFTVGLWYFLFLVVEYAIDFVGQIAAILMWNCMAYGPVIELFHEKLTYHGCIEPT